MLLHIVQITSIKHLIKRIEQGEVMVVTDGSCKDKTGTAAIITESTDQYSKLTFQTAVPGDSKDMSLYRS
jgi:hypothetical protein